MYELLASLTETTGAVGGTIIVTVLQVGLVYSFCMLTDG